MSKLNKQSLDIKTPSQMLSELIPFLKDRKHTPDLPTGIAPIDRHIWGLKRKAVTIVGGRPAEGKSSLMSQIFWNLADIGKKVVYLSLEMSKEEIMERLMCSFCEIDSEDMRRGNLPADFDARAEAFNTAITRMNFRIIDGYGKELAQLHDLFDQFPEKPDAFFIDHIQRISTSDNRERRDAITNYINDCEGLAIQHNLAMVVGSQLNREAPKRKDQTPTLEDLKESGSLEETAGTVLLNYWPKKDAPMSDPMKKDFYVLIAKQRTGTSGIQIPLRYECQYYKFGWPEGSATEWAETSDLNGSQPKSEPKPVTPLEQAVQETFRKDVDG